MRINAKGKVESRVKSQPAPKKSGNTDKHAPKSSAENRKRQEYGVAASCIHKWIKAYSPIENSIGEVTTNADIIKLQKELAKMKEENEILKKAVAIFSKR